MTLYYIVKRGVYDHGVLGIYATLEEAKSRCEAHTDANKQDGDGYHDFVIYRTVLSSNGSGSVIATWEGTANRWEGRTRLPRKYVWKEEAV